MSHFARPALLLRSKFCRPLPFGESVLFLLSGGVMFPFSYLSSSSQLDPDGVGLANGRRLYGIGRFRALVIRRLSRKLGDPRRRGIDKDFDGERVRERDDNDLDLDEYE